MWNAIAQLWTTISMLLSAVHRGASTLDHIARVGEVKSKNWADNALATDDDMGKGTKPAPTTTEEEAPAS